jgi:hypothetical protein
MSTNEKIWKFTLLPSFAFVFARCCERLLHPQTSSWSCRFETFRMGSCNASSKEVFQSLKVNLRKWSLLYSWTSGPESLLATFIPAGCELTCPCWWWLSSPCGWGMAQMYSAPVPVGIWLRERTILWCELWETPGCPWRLKNNTFNSNIVCQIYVWILLSSLVSKLLYKIVINHLQPQEQLLCSHHNCFFM